MFSERKKTGARAAADNIELAAVPGDAADVRRGVGADVRRGGGADALPGDGADVLRGGARARRLALAAVGAAMLAAGAAMLAGCATSAPLRFYTLSAIAPEGAAASGAAAIRVGRVRIPAELDRNEIVQRVDATRVNIGELDRWAAPLDDMIRRVLTADLQARATSTAASTVTVDIEELMGDASCAVTLTASWELKADGAEGRVSTGRETIRVPSASAGACPAGSLPMPMSQALAQLADQISQAAGSK